MAALAAALIILPAPAQGKPGCHSKRCLERVAAKKQRCGSTACNRRLIFAMGAKRWGAQAGRCLVALTGRESGWNHRAYNPSSGATGIPQALPGAKMASAGHDWATNPATQVRWLLRYVVGRYGGACRADAFQRAHGWY